MGIKINTKKLSPDNTKLYDKENHLIGEVRSAAFSPKFEKNSRYSNDQKGIL